MSLEVRGQAHVTQRLRLLQNLTFYQSPIGMPMSVFCFVLLQIFGVVFLQVQKVVLCPFLPTSSYLMFCSPLITYKTPPPPAQMCLLAWIRLWTQFI